MTSTPAARAKRIEDETRGAGSLYGLTSWEREFLASIQSRATLTEKQEATLAEIEAKVFGPEQDERTADLFRPGGRA